MPKTILMLAMYGLEMVEVGGTLARPEACTPLAATALVLGVAPPRLLEFATGEVAIDLPGKLTPLRLRRAAPARARGGPGGRRPSA